MGPIFATQGLISIGLVIVLVVLAIALVRDWRKG